MTTGCFAAREATIRKLVTLATGDPRVVGVVDYGSGSEGRLDPWSDIDVALFIHDGDFDTFARDWVAWVGQLGPLLLAYTAPLVIPGRCSMPSRCRCGSTSPSTGRRTSR